MDRGYIERLEKNLEIYNITIKELKENKKFNELEYPECIESVYTEGGIRFDKKKNINRLNLVIKSIKSKIPSNRAKDSGIIKERKDKLEIHLKKLRKLREDRK